ncbi:MAG: DNA-deoxyinosine glycosylase [Variovorax paradoxus]|uniref:DNA-deoxyinosine glycosylase n=1 Tax=Variovorax paradoxus TaxID=34073 RepID=A0A2W5Q093_VARPD|nr:MAG: DNA-deoxyinosine glycosylase [Variovorax paradoxus]
MTRSPDTDAGGTLLLEGLPPLVGERTAVLVLGSFPSARSLSARQYYAHPQNQFWKILQAIWPAKPLPTGADSYQKRSEWLLERGLGLWDVYARCRRAGSLDSAIRDAEVNDIIVHNGGESHRHARHTQALGVPVYRLPSTSPANASWSFARKLDAWRSVMSAHGLV